MRNTLTTAAITTGSAVLLLLTGCGSGGAEADPTSASGEDLGPLSEIINSLGDWDDKEKANEQMAAVEDAVAACMQAEGFDYIPQDSAAMTSPMDDADMPEWDSLEYAEQYGYGATTWEDMPGATDEAAFEDPNADAVAAMSESEQAAYYEALYGAQDEVTEPTGVETADASGESSEEEMTEYDWTKAGCQGKGQHEVFEAGQVWDDPQFKELFEEINTIYENAGDDDRVLAAQEEWAQCMADAGYDFDLPADAQQSIYDAVNEIPFNEETGEQDAAALAELKTKELATAVADRTCNTSAGVDEATKDATFALEQEFVDAHKDELDALVEKASQTNG